MLNREKVELMTKLAFYEQNEGKEDFKINEYYRKDYAGYHTLCSILWVTLGYVAVVGLVAVAALDFFLAAMSKSMLVKIAVIVVAKKHICVSLRGCRPLWHLAINI